LYIKENQVRPKPMDKRRAIKGIVSCAAYIYAMAMVAQNSLQVADII
jgi:hypothetical protein